MSPFGGWIAAAEWQAPTSPFWFVRSLFFLLCYIFVFATAGARAGLIRKMQNPSILLRLVALLGTLCTVALAQNNVFINPPTNGPIHEYADDVVFAEGSTVNLQWTTNWSKITLLLWQNGNPNYQTLLNAVPAISSYSWMINLDGMFNLDKGEGMLRFMAAAFPNYGRVETDLATVFFFQMYNANKASTPFFSSHYFNITGSDSTGSNTASPVPATPVPLTTTPPTSPSATIVTTSTLPPQTTTSTSPQSMSEAPGQSTTAAPSPSSTSSATADGADSASSSTSSASPIPTSSGGLSSGAKIGIGVGIGVGVSCLLIGGALGFFLRRRTNQNRTGAADDMRQVHGSQPQQSSFAGWNQNGSMQYTKDANTGQGFVQNASTPPYTSQKDSSASNTPPAELGNSEHRHELGGDERSELPADPSRR